MPAADPGPDARCQRLRTPLAGRRQRQGAQAGMLEALQAPAGALVVMDRGVATDDSVTWLRESGYRYLVVSRERHRQFDPHSPWPSRRAPGRPSICTRSSPPTPTRCACTASPRSAPRRNAASSSVSPASKPLSPSSTTGCRAPAPTSASHRSGSASGASKPSILASPPTTDHRQRDRREAAAVTWSRQLQDGSMATHPGVYCLRSSETDWDEDTLWRTYAHRPKPSSAPSSPTRAAPHLPPQAGAADGHLFLTVIAYQLVQVIRSRLRAHGEHASCCAAPSKGRRVTATFRRPDGRTLHVRTATHAEPEQRALYDALGVAAWRGPQDHRRRPDAPLWYTLVVPLEHFRQRKSLIPKGRSPW